MDAVDFGLFGAACNFDWINDRNYGYLLENLENAHIWAENSLSSRVSSSPAQFNNQLWFGSVMICTHRVEDNICIVSFEGNIALDGVNEAKAYLKPYLDSDEVKGLVINFEKVNFIDSSGIGLIVSIFKTMQQKDGKFALSNLSKKNEEIFSITRLNKILEIHPLEEDAVSALKG